MNDRKVEEIQKGMVSWNLSEELVLQRGENKYFRCCPYIKQDKDLVNCLFGLPQWLSTSLVGQLVKNPPAIQETSTGFLGLEDPLEKG